ncbi:MAG: hypothetical protein ACFFCD_10120 [Promethearchaeota archaeon]
MGSLFGSILAFHFGFNFRGAIITFLFAIFSVLFELIILLIFSVIVAALYSAADNSIILEVSPSEKRKQYAGYGALFGRSVSELEYYLLVGYGKYAPWVVFVIGNILIAAAGGVFLFFRQRNKRSLLIRES